MISLLKFPFIRFTKLREEIYLKTRIHLRKIILISCKKGDFQLINSDRLRFYAPVRVKLKKILIIV